MRALGEPVDKQTLELMIASVDTDHNGSIDFEEFKQMMKGECRKSAVTDDARGSEICDC